MRIRILHVSLPVKYVNSEATNNAVNLCANFTSCRKEILTTHQFNI